MVKAESAECAACGRRPIDHKTGEAMGPSKKPGAAPPLRTPDGRYLVVRGRLWRCTNPALDADTRTRLTADLMAARRAKGVAMRAGDEVARAAARQRVDAAKQALGERGPVWWTDGAPDLNRKMARSTPYADWFEIARQSAELARLREVRA